ncbi:glycosyltransferase [Rhizobium binae]|uniref:glycosyltransferase n=1 Tax=Rhizobium binae TaxID=1138190 RepID=UPI001C839C51|nr:glycosyltransferase family 2 protein [Rhizobium binae]MBX4937852.1 glycosyltransferase family 2 protein [Rhizobium binae]MBX4944442.1 glycosyltransferase family 2 protein [Rhizobium binae]MBX4979829.1 glycosyltransferase family 2 protein [Rhizobium binae]
MRGPRISVVFSSFNGAGRRLQQMLNSMLAQNFPFDEWELIAVNNNSSDDTQQLLERYAKELPMTVVSHARPGKSGAMNAALTIARGTLIVFTDDDIEADANWLSAIAACAEAYPDFGVFGGRILPNWEHYPDGDPLLDWIPMGSTFAIADQASSGPCDPTKIWGPNTTVRRDLLGSDVRFREDIGPLPGGLFAMGEDTEIVSRLSRMGVKTFRCAEAIVHHWIPASSVTEAWVQKRGERLGYGMPALFAEDVPKGPKIGGIPLATWIESANWAVRAALLYPLPRSKKRFWAIWKYYYMRGYRAGIRRYMPLRYGSPQVKQEAVL